MTGKCVSTESLYFSKLSIVDVKSRVTSSVTRVISLGVCASPMHNTGCFFSLMNESLSLCITAQRANGLESFAQADIHAGVPRRPLNLTPLLTPILCAFAHGRQQAPRIPCARAAACVRSRPPHHHHLRWILHPHPPPPPRPA
jgi:hypothetical protein